jgi:hypothetical protein
MTDERANTAGMTGMTWTDDARGGGLALLEIRGRFLYRKRPRRDAAFRARRVTAETCESRGVYGPGAS